MIGFTMILLALVWPALPALRWRIRQPRKHASLPVARIR